MSENQNDTIVIYESATKGVEIHLSNETLWLTQKKIAEVFDTSTDNVGLHLKNIYLEQELNEDATTEESSVVQIEGGRQVKRPVKLYNLDAIIAVGYRINSKKATKFRQWATQVIKQHLVAGYTINKDRIAYNYNSFMQAVSDIKNLLPENTSIDNKNILELISIFADTWFSLDAYDKEKLVAQGITHKTITLTSQKLTAALTDLKNILIAKDEASDLFARERSKNALEGILGNVMQSFGDEELYQTVEEKAAHLLYFIIKNHPFVDGNKRSAAYIFVWYLGEANILDINRITPTVLTTLTLLIAESNPKDKERMIGLVCSVLVKKS